MYSNVDAWLAYADLRGDSAPALAPASDQASALLRGDDYIRQVYVRSFAPSVDLAEATVAQNLAEAVHIAAGLELATPGLFSKVYSPADIRTLTKLGDIEWSPLSLNQGGADGVQPRSTAIDALLLPYLGQGAGAGATPNIGAYLV